MHNSLLPPPQARRARVPGRYFTGIWAEEGWVPPASPAFGALEKEGRKGQMFVLARVHPTTNAVLVQGSGYDDLITMSAEEWASARDGFEGIAPEALLALARSDAQRKRKRKERSRD